MPCFISSPRINGFRNIQFKILHCQTENSDTHAVILPLYLVNGIFDVYHDVVSSCNEQMAQRLSAEQLDDEMFEHFFGR